MVKDSVEHYRHRPAVKGRLWVIPSIELGHEARVWVGGDPEGLRSLAANLAYLAGVDQEAVGVPRGERDHIHLSPKRRFSDFGELGTFSCEVELCRADASGTGEIPHELAVSDRMELSFDPDSSPPAEWLRHARESIKLCRASAAGSDVMRKYVPVLASQAVFCSLMAGLRALGITVAAEFECPGELLHFVPDDLVLPLTPTSLDEDPLGDVLRGATASRASRDWLDAGSDAEITLALSRSEEMLAWAEEIVGRECGTGGEGFS
jgi:hypothetical protein